MTKLGNKMKVRMELECMLTWTHSNLQRSNKRVSKATHNSSQPAQSSGQCRQNSYFGLFRYTILSEIP